MTGGTSYIVTTSFSICQQDHFHTSLNSLPSICSNSSAATRQKLSMGGQNIPTSSLLRPMFGSWCSFHPSSIRAFNGWPLVTQRLSAWQRISKTLPAYRQLYTLSNWPALIHVKRCLLRESSSLASRPDSLRCCLVEASGSYEHSDSEQQIPLQAYHLCHQHIRVNSMSYIVKCVLPTHTVSKVGSLCWVLLQTHTCQPLQPVYYQLQ